TLERVIAPVEAGQLLRFCSFPRPPLAAQIINLGAVLGRGGVGISVDQAGEATEERRLGGVGGLIASSGSAQWPRACKLSTLAVGARPLAGFFLGWRRGSRPRHGKPPGSSQLRLPKWRLREDAAAATSFSLWKTSVVEPGFCRVL
ncbi:MAG TPA: hypothetical protein VGF45_06455, partial [Polyangia bacterium]